VLLIIAMSLIMMGLCLLSNRIYFARFKNSCQLRKLPEIIYKGKKDSIIDQELQHKENIDDFQ
jgi:hypothetical protein